MPAFEKIREPRFSARLPGGETRDCDPWDTLRRVAEAKTPEQQRAVIAGIFSFPPGFDLTAHRRIALLAGMLAYVKKFDEAYDAAETNCELMSMYPGLHLADLREMNDLEKLAMLAHGHRLEARRRLNFQQDIGSMFDKDSTLRAELVRVAFAGDEKEMDRQLEVLSRV